MKPYSHYIGRYRDYGIISQICILIQQSGFNAKYPAGFFRGSVGFHDEISLFQSRIGEILFHCARSMSIANPPGLKWEMLPRVHSGHLTELAGKWTLNEDVFPISKIGDMPAIAMLLVYQRVKIAKIWIHGIFGTSKFLHPTDLQRYLKLSLKRWPWP